MFILVLLFPALASKIATRTPLISSQKSLLLPSLPHANPQPSTLLPPSKQSSEYKLTSASKATLAPPVSGLSHTKTPSDNPQDAQKTYHKLSAPPPNTISKHSVQKLFPAKNTTAPPQTMPSPPTKTYRPSYHISPHNADTSAPFPAETATFSHKTHQTHPSTPLKQKLLKPRQPLPLLAPTPKETKPAKTASTSKYPPNIFSSSPPPLFY